MTDLTTKALLLAIAIGLWMNVATQWIRPVVLQAQGDVLSKIASDVNSIARQTCSNSKIC